MSRNQVRPPKKAEASDWRALNLPSKFLKKIAGSNLPVFDQEKPVSSPVLAKCLKSSDQQYRLKAIDSWLLQENHHVEKFIIKIWPLVCADDQDLAITKLSERKIMSASDISAALNYLDIEFIKKLFALYFSKNTAPEVFVEFTQ